MKKRLTKIVTRTGDAGETSTASGRRIAKDDVLLQAQGDIDELNSFIGLLASKIDGQNLEILRKIQHHLFDIGAEITSEQHRISEEILSHLEHTIEELNATLEPLAEFILPGGNEQGATCHVARTVCRRAERNLVALDREMNLNPVSLAYINRLSDYLFILSRCLNDQDEIYWDAAVANKKS